MAQKKDHVVDDFLENQQTQALTHHPHLTWPVARDTSSKNSTTVKVFLMMERCSIRDLEEVTKVDTGMAFVDLGMEGDGW